jgi:hypothetical protein
MHQTVPNSACIALFKGTRPGISGLYNRLGRLIDRGPYSHCEFKFSNGLSASASYMDGGVRAKKIEYSSEGYWDFLPVPPEAEAQAVQWYNRHYGAKYDILGNLRFATNFAKDDPDKWFCSESIMASLGYPEAYRYGPNGLAFLLQFHLDTKILKIDSVSQP